ncbi:UNVERIFIED_CONTAM: hypothetical protein NCL1_48526 [Trichonephila clavipes]
MTVQEMVVAAAASGQVRAVTTVAGGISTAPAVVSVSNLTAVQLAASQRLAGTTLSPATTVASSAVSQLNTQAVNPQRNIAHISQLQAIRQSALIRHRVCIFYCSKLYEFLTTRVVLVVLDLWANKYILITLGCIEVLKLINLMKLVLLIS